MNKRRCLIIDDEDQSSEMERLVSNGSKKGLEIQCQQFNAGAQKRSDLLDGKSLSKEKVHAAFKAECTGRYDLIAFDYQLQDEGGITGVDLVQLLGPEKKTSIKVIYSGMLDSIVKDILNEYATSKDYKKAKGNLITVFNAGISDFIERIGRTGIGYEQVLLDRLVKNEFTTEKLLVKKLEEYGTFHFKSLYPSFKNKTLAEIAAEIDRSEDGHSANFQTELIEHAISNMIDLNKEGKK
jgi:hypothetical protein